MYIKYGKRNVKQEEMYVTKLIKVSLGNDKNLSDYQRDFRDQWGKSIRFMKIPIDESIKTILN